MIIKCPQCQQKLKIEAKKYAGKKLSLTCRKCTLSFSYAIPSRYKILIAHGETEICEKIRDICCDDKDMIQTCHDAKSARKYLEENSFKVLLLDVALPGALPFELIDEVSIDKSFRVILLPSVYNSTAYKRRPSSLYGADAYLEIHHLTDHLIPLFQKLVPDLQLKSQAFCPMVKQSAEQLMPEELGCNSPAEDLARMLITDIALYHQDQIDLGIKHGDLAYRLKDQLQEGRILMAQRIPQVELQQQDYLLNELNKFALARERELGTERMEIDDI